MYSIRLSVSIPVCSTTGFSAVFCGSKFGVGVGFGTGSCSRLLCWVSVIDLVWTPSWLSAMMISLVGVCCMSISAANFLFSGSFLFLLYNFLFVVGNLFSLVSGQEVCLLHSAARMTLSLKHLSCFYWANFVSSCVHMMIALAALILFEIIFWLP